MKTRYNYKKPIAYLCCMFCLGFGGQSVTAGQPNRSASAAKPSSVQIQHAVQPAPFKPAERQACALNDKTEKHGKVRAGSREAALLVLAGVALVIGLSLFLSTSSSSD